MSTHDDGQVGTRRRSIMRSWAITAHRNMVAADRHRLPALLAVLLLVPFAALAQETEEPKPAMQEPAAPQVQERNVKSLSEEKPVQEWKPGDPVRVMGDLREDEKPGTGKDESQSQPPPRPIVREAVVPQVMEGNLKALTKVRPYKEGDPVRVVPDLRESEPKE